MVLTVEQQERIDQIAHGGLTPAAIVADAKQKDSPLHELFDWDLESAAQKFWEEHAREVIRRYRVEITYQDEVRLVPKYVRDTEMGAMQGYVATESLQGNVTLAHQSVLYETERVIASLRRAKDIACVLGLESEVDELIASATAFRGKMKDDPTPV